MTVVIRHKVAVLPFSFDPRNGEKVYLMIQDKESKEWSFVTGGKKQNESFEQAAWRELCEETKNVLSVRSHLKERGSVLSDYRVPKHIKADQNLRIRVRTLIRLFELSVPFQPTIRERFQAVPEKPNDETIDICYMTKREIMTRKDIWSFVQKELAPGFFRII